MRNQNFDCRDHYHPTPRQYRRALETGLDLDIYQFKVVTQGPWDTSVGPGAGRVASAGSIAARITNLLTRQAAIFLPDGEVLTACEGWGPAVAATGAALDSLPSLDTWIENPGIVWRAVGPRP